MFLKNSDVFIENKNMKTTYLQYKQTIQECVDTFALDLLILCLQVRL